MGLLPQNSISFIFIEYGGISPTSIVKKKYIKPEVK